MKPKSLFSLTTRSLFALAAALLATSLSSHASTWSGQDGNWDSNTSTGWNGTGIPNAVGSIASFTSSAAARTTTQNISGGVTVGTLSFTGNQEGSRIIALTNSLTLNQDGAGSGFALIANTNTSTSASNFLQIGSGTNQNLILADNLRVTNAAGAGANGSVHLQAAIGGVGNITFNNANTGLGLPGSIRLGSATNTFTGSVLVQKGTLFFSGSSSLGNISNVVTLGDSGQGNASLLTTTGGTTLENSIVVAANSGGTLRLGKVGTGAAIYTGAISLNGDLTLYSEVSNEKGLDFTGIISGTGSITHGPGTTATATGIVKLSGANTFTGATNLGSPALGTLSKLVLANRLALQNSTLHYTGTSKLAFASTVTSKEFIFGGLTGTSGIALQDNASTPLAIALSVGNNNANTAYSGALSGAGSLTKIGTGSLSLTGTNTYAGPTIVNQGKLIVGVGSVGSIKSNVAVNNGGTLGGSGTITGNVTVNSGGTLAAGNSPGLLTVSNNMTLAADSIFSWELASQTTNDRGTNFDAVNVGGNLEISNSIFHVVITGLDLNSNFWDATQTWQVFNKGLTAGSGFSSFQLFASTDLVNPVSYGSIGSIGNFAFNSGTGSLVWTAVPEPSSALAGILISIGLFRRRRSAA